MACINWHPASAGWNPKKANTAIPRPIVDTQLFIIARSLLFTPRIGRKLMPSNLEWLLDPLRGHTAVRFSR